MKKTIVIDQDVWGKLCVFRGQRIVSTGKDFKLSRAINELLRRVLTDKITCECGAEFVVPPEAVEKGEATCPKCGVVYKGEPLPARAK